MDIMAYILARMMGGGGGGFIPSSAQLAAMNSGINSEKVSQITANQTAAAKADSAAADLFNSGAKNILVNNLSGLEKNGIIGKVNSDGSITLSGTSTKNTAFVLCYDMADGSQSNSYSTKIPIASGEYVCKGTGDSRVKVQAWGYTDSTDIAAYTNSADDTAFTVTTKPYISFRIYIAANADFSTPLTIYPMCCLKSAYDLSSAYVPYRLSAADLSEKVTDFLRYENPVNVSWFSGYIKPADGTVGADPNYMYSSIIKLKKGQRLVWNSTGPSSVAQLAKYVNGAYVGNQVDVTENVRLRYIIPYKFWIADEDCEVRICHRTETSGSSIIVANDDVKPTIYNDEQFLSGSPLWKKKLVVVGDSLVHGSKIGEYATWCNWLAGKYRMTVVNEGINGSSIAEIPEGADGDDLHDPIVDRYQDILRANPDADIVVYEGGANDRTQGVPLGSADSTSKTEFSGAINRIINGTRILTPKAKIFFISMPWRWTTVQAQTGLNEADYAETMRSVCKAKSIPCRNPCFDGDIDFRDSYIQQWADEGLWPNVSDPPEANRHYSPAGYQYIIPRIERFLSE